MATLVIEHEGTGERRRLAGGRLAIGRAVGNDWVIQDVSATPTVSRRHCLIEAGESSFTVTDLGSMNGTKLNGEPIPGNTPTPLQGGDRLELGRHALKVAIEQASGAGAGNVRPGLTTPSLDDVLKDLAGEVRGGEARATNGTSARPGPATKPTPSLDDDPLGSFFDELPREAPPKPPPPKDVGPSRGDHVQPQLESFGIDERRRDRPPPPPPPVRVSNDALLTAFLDGAGLKPSDLAGSGGGAADPAALLRDAGKMFAAMAEGYRELLVTRALVKSHAGVERTVIGVRDNNPLKHARNQTLAVRALLGPPEPGDQDGPAAIEASIRDLIAHEMALLGGVKAALTGLLGQFDPKTLETRLGDASTFGLLLQGGRRAKLWDLFTERYGELAEAARRRFMGDLDDAFREAYARKVIELRRTRQGSGEG